jgi:hypothetical protein
MSQSTSQSARGRGRVLRFARKNGSSGWTRTRLRPGFGGSAEVRRASSSRGERRRTSNPPVNSDHGASAPSRNAETCREGITHVIFGQTQRSRWEILLRGSTLDRFLREVTGPSRGPPLHEAFGEGDTLPKHIAVPRIDTCRTLSRRLDVHGAIWHPAVRRSVRHCG